MDVAEIVEDYLKAHGFDGLCFDECGCELGDLMPCGEDCSSCEPGHKAPCPGGEKCRLDGDCPWHIQTEKPSVAGKETGA